MIFCFGGVDPRKNFGATQQRETIFFRSSRRVQGHAPPENVEKVVFRISEISFLDISSLY